MLKVLSLFSGMGAFEESLKNLSIPYELVAFCEIDKHPAKAYSIIHNEPEIKNLGDITQVNEKELPDFDLLVGGSPCQNFSIINNTTDSGLAGEKSGLFYDYARILNHKKPKYFIFENVKRLLNINNGEDWKEVRSHFDEHYNIYFKVLNTKYFDLSQNRERLFVIGIRKDIEQDFEFPKPKDYVLPIKVHLELGQELTYDYYLTDDNLNSYLTKKSLAFRDKFRIKDIDNDCGFCLTTKSCKAVITNNYLKDIHGIRGLTEREYFRMQGFNPDYVGMLKNHGLSKNQLYKMCGNSISITILERIFKNLFAKEIKDV